ncbi:MAG: TIGR00730 family Rossman fold protein [Phenylobacterium sp.]|uniref:LOG family protein n=1 Tax=Phenylobacterium sp. TaxID=1871053 RepID=UPI001A61E952|nr:TIGR00730 family Rossman fold protein [Phenylobacterium sp.]MBL8771212.1 TIGR00730 family Rossman fold protein [Phenylobacterium sp.]
MQSICVYCGSSAGVDPKFLEAAVACGTRLAREGVTLVYGGGKVGLMGAVADAALAAGGRVVGVMPQGLVDQEIAHRGLTELHVVQSMHERKLKMAELSDAFLCLPGGPGTFEEIFEQWTWALLGIHAKPCGFVNVSGYYDLMRATIQRMADAGFLAQAYVDMLVYADTTEAALDAFRAYSPPPPKWSGAKA